MNFIFVSPDFPKSYYLFCAELRRNGANVLGIASTPYDQLSPQLKEALTEYYRVDNMEDYAQMYTAVAYFAFKYGKIDFIESNNEYWLESDARLRSDFNITTGKKADEILFFKSKEAMKEDYAKAGVKTARYHIPTTYEEGKKFVDKVGYPVIVKPDNGVGAYHTYKIHNEEELKAFYFEHFPTIKYIMEEFIEGDLISYDGISDNNCNAVFDSNEVFLTPVMDIVNHHLDCYYYSNKEMPEDLRKAGQAVLKAFGAKNRYFHLEFFRLTKAKEGLGKVGDLIGLEVNMRCPGGYTPDIIDFSKSVSTYKIYADVMCFGSTNVKLDLPKYYCVYYGRRKDVTYKHSHEEICAKYKEKIKWSDDLPAILAGAMGDYFHIANFETLAEVNEFISFLNER